MKAEHRLDIFSLCNSFYPPRPDDEKTVMNECWFSFFLNHLHTHTLSVSVSNMSFKILNEKTRSNHETKRNSPVQ